MSESSYQPQGYYGSAPQTEAAQRLAAAAADFRRNIQEASDKLSSAGAQLVSVSQELATAIAEAKQAAEQAKEAQRKAEETQQQMQRDYGAISDLVRDLQERIGALATLARPLSLEGRIELLAQAKADTEAAPAQANTAEIEVAAISGPESPRAEGFVEGPENQEQGGQQQSPEAPIAPYGGQSWSSRSW
jgi:DNA repair ATPase RecN